MPLNSWICDTCGNPITDPEMGLGTWRRDAKGGTYDFRIVHKGVCDTEPIVANVDLSGLLGDLGAARLLSLLSAGPLKGPGREPLVDLDGFVDFFRRLQVPWYEEARPHFDAEHVQSILGDANEIYPYTPDVLERIAKDRL
jgi:hypothetical protein